MSIYRCPLLSFKLYIEDAAFPKFHLPAINIIIPSEKIKKGLILKKAN
jgi:hypothetical protein